jgi:uncharacterized protein YndB with AHSA1/START domain
MSNTEIKKTIEVNAPIDIVFRALTDINELVMWWPDKGTFDPKVGGKMHFEFVNRNDDNKRPVKAGQILEGEVLEVIPDKKIVYSFLPRNPYDSKNSLFSQTTVSWILDKMDENRTKITLVHSGFNGHTSSTYKGTSGRWNYFLTRLMEYCHSAIAV